MFSLLKEGRKRTPKWLLSQHKLVLKAILLKRTYGLKYVTDLHGWLTVLGVWRHFLHQADEVEQELGVVVGQFQIIAVLPEREEKPVFQKEDR